MHRFNTGHEKPHTAFLLSHVRSIARCYESGLRFTRWTHDGAEFERERYSFSNARHGLTVEIITVSRSGPRGWSLMVTKEYWWTGAASKPFKNTRWARPLSGLRPDLMAWLQTQEKAHAQ